MKFSISIPAKLHFELDLNFLTVETVGFQIMTILLFHPSKTIGQFAKKKFQGGLGSSSRTVSGGMGWVGGGQG